MKSFFTSIQLKYISVNSIFRLGIFGFIISVLMCCTAKKESSPHKKSDLLQAVFEIKNQYTLHYHSTVMDSIIESKTGYLESEVKEAALQVSEESGYLLDLGNAAYILGEGEKAEKLYLKSASQGNIQAQYNLGKAYSEGQDFKYSLRDGEKWLIKAAEQDNVLAQKELVSLYSGSSEGWKWLRKAAQLGDASCQYTLGLRYQTGNKHVKTDMKKSEQWYTRSAEQGHLQSQYMLAYMIKFSDPYESIKWYKMAALQGHIPSQMNVAYAYRHGEGVEKNIDKAVEWWRKAAKLGDKDAQKILEGRGY